MTFGKLVCRYLKNFLLQCKYEGIFHLYSDRLDGGGVVVIKLAEFLNTLKVVFSIHLSNEILYQTGKY